MKKDFENNKALDELFGGFKSVDEIEKEKEEQKEEESKEVVEIKNEEPKQPKTSKKKEKEESKKATLFTEVDSVVAEYLDLMTFITGQTKKEYINELVKNEIKTSLNISDNSTDEQIHKAI